MWTKPPHAGQPPHMGKHGRGQLGRQLSRQWHTLRRQPAAGGNAWGRAMRIKHGQCTGPQPHRKRHMMIEVSMMVANPCFKIAVGAHSTTGSAGTRCTAYTKCQAATHAADKYSKPAMHAARRGQSSTARAGHLDCGIIGCGRGAVASTRPGACGVNVHGLDPHGPRQRYSNPRLRRAIC